MAEEELKRIHAPAGLDLGRITHEEMALAVIAEMVKVKAQKGNPGLEVGPMHGAGGAAKPASTNGAGASGATNGAASPTVPIEVPSEAPTAKVEPAPAAASSAAGPEEAIDPVCDMTVTVKGARYKAEHEGNTYYFCCPACRKLFIANPQEYLKVKT